jgi:hypothetical protein
MIINYYYLNLIIGDYNKFGVSEVTEEYIEVNKILIGFCC